MAFVRPEFRGPDNISNFIHTHASMFRTLAQVPEPQLAEQIFSPFTSWAWRSICKPDVIPLRPPNSIWALWQIQEQNPQHHPLRPRLTLPAKWNFHQVWAASYCWWRHHQKWNCLRGLLVQTGFLPTPSIERSQILVSNEIVKEITLSWNSTSLPAPDGCSHHRTQSEEERKTKNDLTRFDFRNSPISKYWKRG